MPSFFIVPIFDIIIYLCFHLSCRRKIATIQQFRFKGLEETFGNGIWFCKWRGYTASMRSYFYGVKVRLLTSKDGIPIAFHLTHGKTVDAKALGKIIDKVPAESSIYGDSAYLDYGLEDSALERKAILLKIQRKLNFKGIDQAEQKLEKLKMRKRVETTISDIKKLFPNNTRGNFGWLLDKADFICIWITII